MKTYTKYLSLISLLIGFNANAAISLDNSVSGSIVDDFENRTAGQVVGLLTTTGATYGERFDGQSVTINSGFDELSGSPTSPLTVLSASSVPENLTIGRDTNTGNRTIDGLSAANRQGSLAILLDNDSDVFGFDVTESFLPSWGLSGDIFVEFFANDGTSLDSFTLNNISDSFYGFRVDSGSPLIRGVSIFHTDDSGIGLDNITYSVAASGAGAGTGATSTGGSSPTVPVAISVVPEPSSYAMMLGGLGLVGFMAFRRKK